MVVPLDVLADDHTAAEYVATGLSRRPELAEQKHLVCEAVERLRREKYAPLVPSVLLGFSYGGMGGGLGSTIVNADDRWDADAVAFWEVRNLGIGERSARNETSALIQQAQMRELAVLDQVAREVVEAHTQVLKRASRVQKARESIRAAERSYELNTNRIRNVQGLPIEVLQSIQALAAARLAYLNAVIDYNIAQFELCRAIGWFEDE
jgi:outer membrane protein TolC